MTPTERLIERLESLGMVVERILPALGYWRRADVLRWQAHVRLPGEERFTTIGSWDPITTCARRGIELQRDSAATMSGCPEVHALPRRSRTPESR